MLQSKIELFSPPSLETDNLLPLLTLSQLSEAEQEYFTEISDALKSLLQEWIQLTLRPAKQYSNYTSFNLKNEFERCTGIYLTNDQFKEAMLTAGYLPEDPLDLNWCFKVQPRYTHTGPSYEIHIYCIDNAPPAEGEAFKIQLVQFKATQPYPKGGSAH